MRTARLLFDAELGSGLIDESSLRSRFVKQEVRVRGVPAHAARVAQQVLYKAGLLGYERRVERPARRTREAVLADRAAAPPRFLIRVDEFPHARSFAGDAQFSTRAYERFHAILAEAAVPYLVAVLPRVSREPLDPTLDESRPLLAEEATMLERLRSDGVSLGLHGLDHRTRFASPHHHSELCGLGAAETEALLEQGLYELAAHGMHPRVFVPPYNRFDASQLPVLARRFIVVCGGPESIGQLGFHRTPQWRGETVYLPAYPPFYGTAEEVLPQARRAIEQRSGLWIPVVLHWEWEERDGWRSLRELARVIAPYAARWEDFLAAVARSRGDEEDR